MIPGDIFDLHGFLLKAMDHSVGTLVPTGLAAIPRASDPQQRLRRQQCDMVSGGQSTFTKPLSPRSSMRIA
jgi:hypothetical protein